MNMNSSLAMKWTASDTIKITQQALHFFFEGHLQIHIFRVPPGPYRVPKIFLKKNPGCMCHLSFSIFWNSW